MLSRVAGRLRSLAFKKFQLAFGIPVEYRYGDFAIELPADHMLPAYQRAHPKYDRFLPHLVKYLRPLDTIVDVGANVGDTLAGMVEQNASAKYICIEPDDFFYEHLARNVARIRRSKPELSVDTFKSLIGSSISGVSLAGQGGTKHAVPGSEDGLKSTSLDQLLSQGHHPNIRLLKTDVDGFDYDVIDSSTSVLRAHKPLIFFECEYSLEYQRLGYEKTLQSLEALGYHDWTIFDNFGEVVLRTKSIEIVVQLLRYVWHQNLGRATRTIHYFDVLAVQADDSALIDRVLADYQHS